MRGENRRIASHHLHGLHPAAKRALRIRDKAFRTDPDPEILIGDSFHPADGILSQQDSAFLQSALKDIDGGISEKPGDEEVPGMIVDVLRPPRLLHDAGVHHEDLVTDAHRLLLIMRDEDRRDAGLTLDPADLLPCPQTEPGIQIRQRFVEKQHARALHQRAGDRDPLLLTPGHLARLPVHQILDLHEPGHFQRLLLHLLLRQPVRPFPVLKRKDNVVMHGQMGIERVALKYHADASFFRRKVRHVLITEEDPPLRRLLQPADQIQRRALSAAGRTQKPHQLSVRNLIAETAYGCHLRPVPPSA